MEVAVQIRAQFGLNWPRWQRLAKVVEDCGYSGLFRSDHLATPVDPDREALELWTSLVWLASHSTRINFGPLVSPVSFRHPVLTAFMASSLEGLSGERFQLGLGAGWQNREHRVYGFHLLPYPERLERFEEGLEVITRLLRHDPPVTFGGKYFQLNGATLLPRPTRVGSPPIIVGGGKSVLPLAARFADEWNADSEPFGNIIQLNAELDTLLRLHGRHPSAVRRSLTAGIILGLDANDRDRKVYATGQSAHQLGKKGVLVGTVSEVVHQIQLLANAGVERIFVQWSDLDDLDGLKSFARAVLPVV